MFRRGFKTWCETIAVQKRRQLRLSPTAPLDPRILATQLGVYVRPADQIPDLSAETLHRLLAEDPDGWSALTVSAGRCQMVVLNPAHSAARQASDLMHELAHIIIGHKPPHVFFTDAGLPILSAYDRDLEDEAAWLAGALLLPRGALLYIRRQGLPETVAAEHYGTSMKMLRFRLSVTGVNAQVRRTARLTR